MYSVIPLYGTNNLQIKSVFTKILYLLQNMHCCIVVNTERVQSFKNCTTLFLLEDLYNTSASNAIHFSKVFKVAYMCVVKSPIGGQAPIVFSTIPKAYTIDRYRIVLVNIVSSLAPHMPKVGCHYI